MISGLEHLGRIYESWYCLGMNLAPASGALLLALATSLTVSLPGQSPSPAAPTENPTKRTAHSKDAGAGKRKIPCKTPENAAICYWTRGRLSVYEGGAPSYRLWKIGTRRILGIFNGPSHFPPAIEEYDENPELPETLLKAYQADNRRMKKRTGTTWTIPPSVFADFEVCPLEPEKKGEMQAVCIESAKNIFVEPEN